jgi:hypothetical protein
MKMYTNGVFYLSTTGLTGPLSWSGDSPPNFYIGYGHRNYFSGAIANFQLYNTSLDANQISALYQEGIGGAPVAPQSIVGWWPLNGDTTDYSGNNNNGAPTNVVFTSAWTGGYTTP